jgi:hypothetical protein
MAMSATAGISKVDAFSFGGSQETAIAKMKIDKRSFFIENIPYLIPIAKIREKTTEFFLMAINLIVVLCKRLNRGDMKLSLLRHCHTCVVEKIHVSFLQSSSNGPRGWLLNQ